jgi:hypothetical protein
MKMRKNDKIKFLHISETTGKIVMLQGTVLGFGAEVRKMWPDEMAEAPDDMMLVQRADASGNISYFSISPADVVSGVFYLIGW